MEALMDAMTAHDPHDAAERRRVAALLHTAALTPRECLRPATAEEAARAVPGIGHHRFDAECPDYDRDVCMRCVHDVHNTKTGDGERWRDND